MYEQYTDKQIVEMLKPKLNKCTAQIDWDVVTSEPDSLFGQMFWGDILKAISIAYRSGYIRGQLGRSFIIGEKKVEEKKAKEPVNPFKAGDKVKFLGLNIEDEEALNNRRFFPPVNTVGEVVELGSDYCFVQWPEGTTADNGVWACRNYCLEKITERWVGAVNVELKKGDRVKMIDNHTFKYDPAYYPAINTIGAVEGASGGVALVQWPERKEICELTRLEVLLCE